MLFLELDGFEEEIEYFWRCVDDADFKEIQIVESVQCLVKVGEIFQSDNLLFEAWRFKR